MLTWHLDRLLRSGPWTALATLLLPAALAVIVAAAADVDDVVGIMLVASGILFTGTLVGSTITSGLGVLLFGVGAISANVSPWLLLVVGIGLFAALILHDLAGAFRRAPRINSTLWWRSGQTVAVVGGLSLLGFAIAYAAATRASWAAIVVPFAIAAIGFAAKLAADAHQAAARELLLRRSADFEQPEPAEDR